MLRSQTNPDRNQTAQAGTWNYTMLPLGPRLARPAPKVGVFPDAVSENQPPQVKG